MVASEENSALFPIFVLTIMALPLVPYTIHKLLCAASKKTKSIHCPCAVCLRSGKYRKSIFKRVSFASNILTYYLALNLSLVVCFLEFLFFWFLIQISNFSTYSNLTVVLLWVVMVGLVYYIKHVSREVIRVCCGIKELESWLLFFIDRCCDTEDWILKVVFSLKWESMVIILQLTSLCIWYLHKVWFGLVLFSMHVL